MKKHPFKRHFIFGLTAVLMASAVIFLFSRDMLTTNAANVDTQADIPNDAPGVVGGPSDGGSSATTPTTEGNDVVFTATANDSNNNNYFLAICKTDSITANDNAAPSCASGEQLCVSSSTATGTESTCSFNTAGFTAESQDWYAFVCDDNTGSQCSASSQGDGDTGSPFKVNHAPSFGSVKIGPTCNLNSIPANPILSYNFNSDAGSGVITDNSGHGNNATCPNDTCPTWTSNGKYGGAEEGFAGGILSFDATNSSIPSGYAPRTVCMWLKPSDVSGDTNILNMGVFDWGNHSLRITRSGSDLGIGSWGGESMTIPSFFIQDEWKHLCLTYDGTNATVYGNGDSIAGPTAMNWDLSPNTRSIIGEDFYNFPSTRWRGTIDEFRIYNRSLSAGDVSYLYANGSDAPSTAGPVLWYNFNIDTTGGIVSDTSGHGNNGAVNGPVWNATGGFDGRGNYLFSSGNYINVTNNIILSDYSIDAWIKPSDPNGEYRVVSNAGYGNTDGAVDLLTAGGRLVIINQANGGQDVYRSTSNTLFSAGVWAHVAVTYDAANLTPHLYVNGAETPGTFDSGSTMRVPNSNPSYTFKIGQVGNLLAGYFVGSIDDAHIYNRFLSAEDITKLYQYNNGVSTLPENPFLSYNFNNSSAIDKVISDNSGHNNNAACSGSACPTWATPGVGEAGGAFHFDGTNYLAVPNNSSLNPANEVTMSAWVKFDSLPGATTTIISKPSTAGWNNPYASYALRVGSIGNVDCWAGDYMSNDLNASTGLVIGQWYMVTCTYDGTTEKVYVNGMPTDARPASGPILSTNYPLMLGTNNSAYPNESFNGSMDEVRVYNRALSDDDVSYLFTNGTDTPSTAGPVMLQNFNSDAVGGAVSDISNNGHDATCSGSECPSWTSEGKFGGAFQFDGANNYLTTSNLDMNQFTASAWIKRGRTSFSDYEGLLGSSGCNGWTLGITPGNALYIATSCIAHTESIGTISDTNWHLATAAFDGTNVTFYIDGVQAGIQNYPAHFVSNGPYFIGTDQGKNFQGKIDDVRVYNRVLSAEDILNLSIYNPAFGQIPPGNSNTETIPAGELDPTFGTNGIVKTNVGNYHSPLSHISSIAIQSNGKIVAGGYAWNNSNDYDFSLARYNTDGSLDTDFGTGGIVTTPTNAIDSDIKSVAIQNDGKIVAAGWGWYNFTFTLARYNTDGSLDTGFGTDGFAAAPVTSGSFVITSAVIQSDGKIVTAGSHYYNNNNNIDFALARYNTDGSLDTDFGTGGIVSTQINSGNSAISSVVIQSDGKIVVAGSSYISNNNSVLARYNADGSLDTSFGTGGIVAADSDVPSDFGSVALQSDGKIVTAGNGNNSNFVISRYNTNGAPDTGFGTGGIVTTDNSYYPNSVTIQSDGKIVAVGHNYNEGSEFGIARYNADGSPDTGFGTNGFSFISIGIGHDYPYAVKLQSDGKIVVAGDSEDNSALIRLESLSYDETFIDSICVQATVNDPDIDTVPDTVDMHVCDTDSFVNGTCGGTTLCSVTKVPSGSAAHCNAEHQVPIPTAHGQYPVYVFIDDNHGLQGTGTPENNYTVTDVPPTLVSYSATDSPAPPAGGYDTVDYSVLLRDNNGDGDVSNVRGVFFDKTAVNNTCSANENNCYISSACTLTDVSAPGTGKTATGTNNELGANCSAQIWYNANASSWDVEAVATDNNGDTSFADAGVSLVNDSLLGISVAEPSISYGTLAIGDISSGQPATMANMGNQVLDVFISGSQMCSPNSASCDYNIPALQQKWSDSQSFDWDTAGNTLVETPSGNTASTGCYDANIGVRTDHTSDSTDKPVFWKLQLPVGTATGSYTGQNTFTSTADGTCSIEPSNVSGHTTENHSVSLSCPSGTTISSFTSKYGIGCGTCGGGAGVDCGSCTIGSASCDVFYSNNSCGGDCNVNCGKDGDLTITCSQ